MSQQPKNSKKNSVYLKNRSANYHYFFEDTLTAGIVLTGSEIKSIRLGKVSFKDSFCYFHKNELWLKNLYIGPYEYAGNAGHNTTRERKLLLNRRELDRWQLKMRDGGVTIIPMAIFTTEKGLAKVKIGLGKGKKLYDKRETIKQREIDRKLRENKW